MTIIGKVVELWRYPVSSLAGERVYVLEASETGIPNDRDFGVVDSVTGAVASPGREDRWRPALAVQTRIGASGETEIKTPASGWTHVLSIDACAVLTGHFGFPAEVRPYQTGNSVSGYEGPWAVNRYQPSALHLLTTASIAELHRLHPNGNPDHRRFRPNIVVEMAAIEGAFPETGWIGRTLHIGDLKVQISEPTRRCGMTVIAQDDVPHDPEILRQLVRNNAHNIGVYCAPESHGILHIGDTVSLE